MLLSSVGEGRSAAITASRLVGRVSATYSVRRPRGRRTRSVGGPAIGDLTRFDDDDGVELQTVRAFGRQDDEVGRQAPATPGRGDRRRRVRRRAAWRRSRSTREPATMTATRPGVNGGDLSIASARRARRRTRPRPLDRTIGMVPARRTGRGGSRSGPRQQVGGGEVEHLFGRAVAHRQVDARRRAARCEHSSSASHDADDEAVVA